ncbi:MAG: YihY/virulence factor BrkB family protein [Pseudohongiella sp.]|nr:YihY/virulence factor BrkB family protein [Pseudohongiella sp.]MDO9521624.1 YihY/virulence factor BrkB family protein [Pseudohongiella sp.]MDP2127851.1 YihY/virulence factor BrkB family protein [Pseudohongiella sp.]
MPIRSPKDLINVIDSRLWREHESGKYKWRKHTARAMQIAYAVLRDIAEGHLSLRAMSLVYYTVIAIVPLLALTFAVLKGLGVHNAMEPALLGLLQPFMGEYSIQITDNVVSFVDNVRVDVLSVVSLGVLLYTVLTMMQQIELTFNYIWSITQPRTLAHRISEYLFAIIVSPLLILISVGIASSVNATFFVRYLEELTFGAWIIQSIAFVMPALFMSLAFALAFVFIPNTRVRFSSAFIGGVVTMIAWKSMALIFQNFIAVNTANAVIYAAFFAIILLMLFLYLGWLMLLIGSAVAFYHQYPAKARTGREPLELSFEMQEEVALSVAYLIVKRFSQGQDPWNVDELAAYTRISVPIIETAVTALVDAGFISATDEQPRCYLPHHSVEDSSVNALRKLIRQRSGTKLDQKSMTSEQAQIHQFLNDMDEHWSTTSGELTFRQLLLQEPESE